MSGDGYTRREVLQGLGAAALAGAGCASLPRLPDGRGDHPCTHRYCRYWQAPPESEASGPGHCRLALRERAGTP